jgi:hypothetical protein
MNKEQAHDLLAQKMKTGVYAPILSDEHTQAVLAQNVAEAKNSSKTALNILWGKTKQTKCDGSPVFSVENYNEVKKAYLNAKDAE